MLDKLKFKYILMKTLFDKIWDAHVVPRWKAALHSYT